MRRSVLKGLAAGALMSVGGHTRAAARPLTIFAAASLETALNAVAAAYRRATGQEVRFSYAASGALARQIQSGAPADVFVSADLEWMDHLQKRQLIAASTRRNVLRNRLVLIAPAASRTRIALGHGMGLRQALGRGRLAVADPASVPAGRYARAALAALGEWDAVHDRLAVAENVRATLAYVARDQAPLGVVYETDALADRRVRVVDHFPEHLHPPIVYPGALTLRAGEGALRFLEHLSSPAAQATFARYGFRKP
jgi:molybdate transport system substrate-binding protein